jgi:predicted PurR-regulated permease PerM
MDRRLAVLGGTLAGIAGLAAVILIDVLGTVFFALTVAFFLAPLRQWLRQRGRSRLTATVAVTTAAFVGVIALFAPIGYLVGARFSEVVSLLSSLPTTIPIEIAGFSDEIVIADALAVVESWFRTAATRLIAALPVLLIKLTLFVLLVFSLLYNERDIRSSVLAVIPPSERDIAHSLHKRARETLYALYVLQAATALGTFLIALPVFFAWGYSSPFALATVAAILQFIPVVGPSVLIAALVIGEFLAGDVVGAVGIGVVGGGLIAWLPDLAIRPRLARRTADLDGSLYFIGFVGGLLSLGAIGVIVGPLVVALLAETAGLVADEFDIEAEGS